MATALAHGCPRAMGYQGTDGAPTRAHRPARRPGDGALISPRHQSMGTSKRLSAWYLVAIMITVAVIWFAIGYLARAND